ncbi:carbohydrate ABC transporter permease [Thermasporomyces composti]|jgi:multiple sugar transport system permease protein|uniref:Carbohydrate ABC transporter membrane protein 2 (CUT1 family) n=1 Tax=Thermasporomyces composti TaxID=696763 RepID=A0A3D9VCY7_THECX|nr:carbohydrate ABC transporter permease [Thermasporomyces composti]REF36955.1 carbohydrate ABC transporter membrane protein 2 (CUT1 family) [Thermasporomyces composti]
MTRLLRNVVLVALALVWLIPTYLLVVNALTPAEEYTGSPVWIPVGFGFVDNLAEAWASADLGLGIANSLLYATMSAAIAVLAAALASFAVVVMPIRRRGLWFWLIYTGTLLPLQIFLAPLFKAYVGVQIYDTQIGLVLIYSAVCVPFAFFVVRNYLTTVPVEITEAAQLDGAGWFRLFWLIHLPLARSSLLAAFIFQFTWVWNDLLFGITLSTSPNIRPVMAALAELNDGYASLGPPVVLAAALAVSVPTVVLFLAFQRFFVSSLKPVG